MSASVKAGKAPDKYWRAQLAPLPPQGRSQALAAGLRQPPLEAGVRARQADKAPPSEAGGRGRGSGGGRGASLSKVLFLLTYKG